MSVNVEHISVSPQRVFDVLAEHRYYGHGVVGSRAIRGADPEFPGVGSRFHHQVGIGPIHLSDHTEVCESSPPNRLVLHARARPLGTMRITMEVAPEGGGSRVTMVEEPGDIFTRLVFNPIADRFMKGRNVEALRRLKEIAEGHGPSPEEAAAPS